jgi:hypothetical protein
MVMVYYSERKQIKISQRKKCMEHNPEENHVCTEILCKLLRQNHGQHKMSQAMMTVCIGIVNQGSSPEF